MTYNLLGLLILVCYAYADFVSWDGKDFVTGQKIQIEIVNDELGSPLSPTQFVYPASYNKQPYALSGTTDKTKAITFTIQSATKRTFNTPVTEYPNFQYTGWEVTLKNQDLGGNIYRWRNRYAMDVSKNPAATTIVFATQTYDASTVLSAPYVWIIRPDSSFPEGVAFAGGILNAKIPIGDVSWVRNTNLKKEGCKYKVWVDSGVSSPPPAATNEIRIFSCDATSSTYYFDQAAIRYLAQTADSIIIRSTNNPAEYVKTTPNSYALDSLRIGRTLSFTPNNPPGNSITTDWTGPMVNYLWNTGMPDTSLITFSTIPYWACGNTKGLHIGSFPNNICQWDYSGATTPGGISVYITRNVDANIPIWRCNTKSSVTSQIPLLPSNALIQAVGAQTKAITIYSTLNPTESVTTTSSNAYSINSLKAGKSLSFQTNGGYAIQSDWTGSKYDSMWNSCGAASDFISTPYWACNNGNGLHLKTDCCNWTPDCGNSPPGGITIAIQPLVKPPVRFLRIWSCSNAGQYALDFSLSQIQTFASQATQVTIMSRNNPDEYVTSTSSSFALQSLQNGKSLSHSTTNGYTSSSQWVGTKTDAIWNSCGNSQPFDQTVFWACNNGGGLHITNAACGWTSAGTPPQGGIGVYLHMPN